MSWVYVLANNKIETEDIDIIRDIQNQREIEYSDDSREVINTEEYEITPDELFDEKYSDVLFDVLWELKEINSEEDNRIKFKDFNKLIGDLYEFIKENSSGYYEEEEEEVEEDEESDIYEDG